MRFISVEVCKHRKRFSAFQRNQWKLNISVSATKDMVKVIQDIARAATKQAKADAKGAGTDAEAAAEQEAVDDSANGLRAAVLDAAINLQTVVGEVVKSGHLHGGAR